MKLSVSFVAAAAALAITGASAQMLTNVSLVNGLALDGGLLDKSSDSAFDRRVGFFSDLYYDASRNAWWGLSDRGSGGGMLSYETRVQRFTLDVNPTTGAISNFAVAETIKFRNAGVAMNGLAPSPTNVLGNPLDPEGFAVNPKNGNFLVSDEYGPSLIEFDRSGNLVRRYTTPTNVVPRSAADTPNFAGDAGNTQGKRTNRGFEGLAVSADGKYAYAMLQSAMLDEGAGNGVYNRIVKFDTGSGLALAQYAYKMDASGQGRGISALVALGNDKFLVLERNNRGVGIGADLKTADKNVYQIDLAGATKVSAIDLDSGAAFTAVSKGAKLTDLDADTLVALGNKSPEKWEGLAVGPKLANGKYLVLAGTDNDYSVTQNSSGVQFDVWLRMTDADPYATSIQCPVGTLLGCNGTLTADYTLLPGVLHAYTANIDGYTAPVPEPEPETYALMLAGLGLVGAMSCRAVPKAEYRSAKHAGCLMSRRAASKADTAVRSTQAA